MNLSMNDVLCTEGYREFAGFLLGPCVFFELMLNDKFQAQEI